MFRSLYLNCSDDPNALYRHLKKLLLFNDRIHIMNPRFDLIEEQAGIKPHQFIHLCKNNSKSDGRGLIVPIFRENFINNSLRVERADLSKIDFDAGFYSRLEEVAAREGRILDESTYKHAHAVTDRTLSMCSEEDLANVTTSAHKWLASMPVNRQERMLSIMKRDNRSLEWMHVDSYYQEIYVYKRSDAEEHAPTSMDFDFSLEIGKISRGMEFENRVYYPHRHVDPDNILELLDDLFPSSKLSEDDVSGMTVFDIMDFHQAHMQEIKKINDLLQEAKRQRRSYGEALSEHATNLKQEIDGLMAKFECSVGFLVTFAPLALPGSLTPSVALTTSISALSYVATLYALKAFIPQFTSRVRHGVANSNLIQGNEILYSSNIFLNKIYGR